MLLLSAQGCGGSARGGLIVVENRPVAVHGRSAPPAEPPPASDVLMLGASDWLLVGTHGVDGEEHGPAFIERTQDAGRHWSTVFSAPHAELWWVGRDGASVVVAGAVSRGDDATGEETAPRALLLRSTDGGATFSAIYPRIPHGVEWQELKQFAFSGHGTALAVPKADAGLPIPPGLLLSGDDGHTWQVARLPADGTADWSAVWTPNGREAFVAGYTKEGSPSGRCGDTLWRSTDAGATWQLVPGACGYPDMGVAFVDSMHGFIASGSDPKFRSGQVVRATDDGGEHWRVAWRDREQHGESPIVQLQFVDSQHGWALPGYVSLGSNFAYLGDALSTSDGGKHWRDTGQLASALSALPGGSALALVSSDSKGAPELALTRDYGARWTQLTTLRDVQTEALRGGASMVSDVTNAGTFVSSDGGEQWTAFDPPQFGQHSTLLAARPGITASLDDADNRCALLLSSDGGEHWRTVAPPDGTLRRIAFGEIPVGGGIHCTETSAAFSSPNRGLAAALPDGGSCKPANAQSGNHLYTTTDGGRHWQLQRAVPLGSASEASVAASGETYVIVTDSGGGVDERHCTRIAISRDSGRSWTIQAFPSNQECSSAAVYANEIWLTCGIEQTEHAHSLIYHSTDGGRTWRTYTSTGDAFAPSQIVATGPGRALATSDPESETAPKSEREGPSLWRTSDGGATWTQSWPALPIGPTSEPTPGHPRE
jgi:photosystem II stability/assembly factor-like uncharacterized protein